MHELIFSVFPNENFVDLGLYQYGWEQCTPSHSYGPAARNHYLFHYVISGTGTLMANDSNGNTQTYQVKSGQGFMLFPGQITTYSADRDLPWEYAWVEFDGLRAKGAVDLAGLSLNQPIYHARSKDLRESMMNEMMYLVEHKDMPPLHLIGHVYLFLDFLTRSAVHMSAPKTGRLRDFYIKEALGKTPQEFLLNYRMIKAAELLKLTGLSIGDISNAVGYTNQLHFSRAFKNMYGLPPREWRNQNKILV